MLNAKKKEYIDSECFKSSVKRRINLLDLDVHAEHVYVYSQTALMPDAIEIAN